MNMFETVRRHHWRERDEQSRGNSFLTRCKNLFSSHGGNKRDIQSDSLHPNGFYRFEFG